MFSQTAEYALRAAVCLSDSGDRSLTTQEIADRTQVPRDYLSKVLRELARAGLVLAQRGKNGGFSLLRPPERVTIYDVVDAVDPVPRIKTCPLRLQAHRERLCPLHAKLDCAYATVESELRSATLAQMLESDVKPLCEAPATGLAEAAHA